MRLRLDLAYDGTEFAGWARQPGLRTVQRVVEEAIATVLRLPDPPRLVVAGRTDAGVHATGQVTHFDLAVAPDDIPMLQRRLNGVLPRDVTVRALRIADPDFHARFAALGRHYIYRVADGIPNPVRRRDTVSWPRSLDPLSMNEAAKALVGVNDFAAFCKPRKRATTIRTLHELSTDRDQDGAVVIEAHADAFCHSQVRSMVGALLAVGEGRRPVSWPAEVLAGRVRNSLVNVAPALGLCLVAVDYPPDDQLAERATLTRQRRQI